MNTKFNVIQVGLGPMGRIIAKLFLERKNINLKAVIDIDPKLKDKNLCSLLNIEEENDMLVREGGETWVFVAVQRFEKTVRRLSVRGNLFQKAPIVFVQNSSHAPWAFLRGRNG